MKNHYKIVYQTLKTSQSILNFSQGIFPLTLIRSGTTDLLLCVCVCVCMCVCM